MDSATWELIRHNLQPMLEATVTKTLPLTAISFAIGLVLALFVALARMSKMWPVSAAARFYISIILPQAARIAVPPLSNTLISLVKDTSLASTILVTELLRTAQLAAAPTFDFFALYGVAAVYYWVICLILGFAQTRLETRLARHVAR